MIRPQRVRESLKTARACTDAGIRTVEITSVSPAAREAVRKLSSSGDMCVGAGTVMSRDSAEEFCSLGARFAVSPHTGPEIIEYCGEAGVAVIQGTFTSSEIVTAAKAGADFVKISPALSFGPDYVGDIIWVALTLRPTYDYILLHHTGDTEDGNGTCNKTFSGSEFSGAGITWS